MWDLNLLLQLLCDDFWVDKPDKQLRARANILLRISVAGRNSDVWAIHRESIRWHKDHVCFRYYDWKTKPRAGAGVKFSEWIRVNKLNYENSDLCAFQGVMSIHESP